MAQKAPSSTSARLAQIAAQLPVSRTKDEPRAQPPQGSQQALKDLTKAGSRDQPDIILFFAWTAPSRSALVQFKANYAKLYPDAQILVFKATISDFMPWPATSQAFRDRGFEEALQAIADLSTSSVSNTAIASTPARASGIAAYNDSAVAASANDSSTATAETANSALHQPRILVHAFSNGGSVRAASFCAAYRRRFGHALPASAFIFDSCLTRSNIAQVSNSVRDHVFLPQWPYALRMALWMPFLLVIWLSVSWMPVTGEVPEHEATWERWAYNALNDDRFVPKVPRAYAQGTKDMVVLPKESSAHAAAARAAGYDVRYETFEGAVHTASALSEPARYWRLVADTWALGMTRK